METYSKNVCGLKHQFVSLYKGNSHTTEILPNLHDESFLINSDQISLLHGFLNANPIYSNQISEKISNKDYTIFEGDLNNYWIDSIKHDASYAPFYTTWMLSAWGLAIEAKNQGFEQIVDIGSGDGRIAFCGKVSGLDAVSIEIDESLVNLQEQISLKTDIDFKPVCADATIFDFGTLPAKKSIFVIGGVPEIGEVLAESVIKNVLEISHFSDSSFVLTGSHSHREYSRDISDFGWGLLIKKFQLSVMFAISLPTYWTMDQKFETPYVFTKKG